MDTDGTVVKGVGSCQFAVTNQRLADDVYELVVSLGYRCGRTTKRVQGRSEATSTCYILNFSTTDDVFRLERKHLLHKEERPATTARIGRRYITTVRPVPSVPVRCVQVDNDDHLYLAGESMIPTHNSTLALDLCRAASIHNNLTSVLLQPGDDALRDHDAAALGRGEGPAQPHPQRQDERRRLGQAGPQDGPRSRRRRCSSTTRPT